MKPQIVHPADLETVDLQPWANGKNGKTHNTLVVQGFHPGPRNRLQACLTTSDGTEIATGRTYSHGTHWVFTFDDPTENDTHVLSVYEVGGTDKQGCCSYLWRVKVGTLNNGLGIKGIRGTALPHISWPSANPPPANPIPQTFSAWGTSNSSLQGHPLTMVGCDGAVTDGIIQQDFPNWVVQFTVTDNPLQNPYTLTIGNASGPQSVLPIYLCPNPPTS